MTFDICVIGAGMVGSAAAKWLSLNQHIKVCLIGPKEPTEEEYTNGKRQIFGAHYDEGRITRELDTDYTWGLLAQRSIENYRDIEKQSGIDFYEEVGCIFIDKEISPYRDDYLQTGRKLNAQFETFGHSEFHSRYPYLHIEKGCQCIWTPKKAGYISPRRLVSAQQKIAASHGCEIVDEVVVKVEEEPDDGHGVGRREGEGAGEVERGDKGGGRGGKDGGAGAGEDRAGSRVRGDTGGKGEESGRTEGTDGAKAGKEAGGSGHVKVTTETGREILALRVLLCTGAFTNYPQLLPDHRKIALEPCKVMVVKAQVSAEDALRMADMPSVSLENEECYILPPILYPDGNYYIKIGIWFRGHDDMNLDEAAQWFRTRGRKHEKVQYTIDVLKRFIPDLKPLSWTTDSCSVTDTPTRNLYCDMISSRTGALVGMNGWGAKSSNEIGRMGASMITAGVFNYDLSADLFKIQFKD